MSVLGVCRPFLSESIVKFVLKVPNRPAKPAASLSGVQTWLKGGATTA